MATDNKYDRQLRLWGANGQAALAAARILVLNASGTASETLKNLVLPGIGFFCVVDAGSVEPRDLGRNFFLSEEHVGQPRAVAMTEMLLEMNEDVRGDARVCEPLSLFEQTPNVLQQESWSLVIATQMSGSELRRVADACWETRVPLLVARTVGLLGYLRVQVRSHEIVESKPVAEFPDLRLAQPWAELREFFDGFDLASLDDRAHRHVPFVVIQYKALQEYTREHGHAPTQFRERKAFREMIRAASRNYDMEVNFQEACDSAATNCQVRPLPGEVLALCAAAADEALAPAASDFQVMVAALGDFVENEGGGSVGPLNGSLPDMTSDTEPYVRLQGIYAEKARQDMAAFRVHLARRLASAGRAADTIAEDAVARFCKNAANLRSVETSRISAELEPESTLHLEPIAMQMSDPSEPAEQTPALWYLALRALDAAAEGAGDLDEGALWALLEREKGRIESFRISPDIPMPSAQQMSALTEAHAKEMIRFRGLEPHATAATIGGIASQEAVKLVTKQYEPLNSTIVYNGVCSVLDSFEI